MIVGHILYVVDEEVTSVDLNGILKLNEIKLSLKSISKAKETLFINFKERIQKEDITMLDVVINNMIYLGEFTKEEFEKNVKV